MKGVNCDGMPEDTSEKAEKQKNMQEINCDGMPDETIEKAERQKNMQEIYFSGTPEDTSEKAEKQKDMQKINFGGTPDETSENTEKQKNVQEINFGGTPDETSEKTEKQKNMQEMNCYIAPNETCGLMDSSKRMEALANNIRQQKKHTVVKFSKDSGVQVKSNEGNNCCPHLSTMLNTLCCESVRDECEGCQDNGTVDICQVCPACEEYGEDRRSKWCPCGKLSHNPNHCTHRCSYLHPFNQKVELWGDMCAWCFKMSDKHCPHQCQYMNGKCSFQVLVSIIVGTILYLFDIGSDIQLVFGYYYNKDVIWASLTLLCITFPGICISVFNVFIRIKARKSKSFTCSTPTGFLSALWDVLSSIPLVTPLIWRCKLLHQWGYWSYEESYVIWKNKPTIINCQRYIFANCTQVQEVVGAMVFASRLNPNFPSIHDWMERNQEKIDKYVECMSNLDMLESAPHAYHAYVFYRHLSALKSSSVSSWSEFCFPEHNLDNSIHVNQDVIEQLLSDLQIFLRDPESNAPEWVKETKLLHGNRYSCYKSVVLCILAYIKDSLDQSASKIKKREELCRCNLLLSTITAKLDILLKGVYDFDECRKTLSNMLMVEGFLECAPQMLLQLYIMLTFYFDGVPHLFTKQTLSIVTSWISISWSMVNVYTSTHPGRFIPNIDKCILFMWQFLTIGPRLLALALFASVYNWALFAFCGVHIIIMFIYHVNRSYKRKKTDFINKPNKGILWTQIILGSILVSGAYVFGFNPNMAFFKMKFYKLREFPIHQNQSLWVHYTFYYVLVSVENIILIGLWYYGKYAHVYAPWHVIITMVAIFVVFGIGIIFMVIYYTNYHLNRVGSFLNRGYMFTKHRDLYRKSPQLWYMFGWILGYDLWMACKLHRGQKGFVFGGRNVENPIHPGNWRN